MLKYNVRISFYLIALTFLLGGCVLSRTIPAGSPTTQPPHRATDTPPPTVTRLPFTATPSHTPTPTFTPTVTPSATRQPSSTPTWTPLPTLPPDQASQLIQDLLLNNAGCKLPCWWGFTPGTTPWYEARQFLESFIQDIGQGGTGNLQGNLHTNYGLTYSIQGTVELGNTLISVTNGIITGIRVSPPAAEQSYLLHQLLTEYGPPAEVVIQTFPNTPIDYLPFWLILYYPERGIYAFYEYHAQKQGDLLLGCPQPIGPELYLWNPEEKTTLDEINDFILGEPLWIPRPLAEVTNFDLESFYQTFQQASNTTCLETPAEIWP